MVQQVGNGEHGAGEYIDNISELREIKDASTIIAMVLQWLPLRERCACMPCGSHDPMTEEQPRENNSAGGVTSIPQRRRHATDNSPARRGRVGLSRQSTHAELKTV